MTTESRKIQLETEVDATGARKGFEEIKTGARDMAAAVGQAGQQAGAGMGAVGSGGDSAAQKVDRATKSIIASIQRTTATMEAGERGSAKFYEALANQRGVSVDALRPYLQQLDEVTKRQEAARASLGNVGISAAQTAAAMRQVPAQFTDIVTSLQAGQAPMTVLLQQGGQLKDMFGGVGAAARAMGTYIAGLVTPFSVAAAALALIGGAGYLAWSQNRGEMQAFEMALIRTNGVLGITSTELSNTANVLASGGFSRSAAASALTELARGGDVAKDSLKDFTQVALDMSKYVDQSVGDTVKIFAKLADEPVKASTELTKQMHYLSAAQLEQIKSLEDAGRKTDAARIAQQAYADAVKPTVDAYKANLGPLETALAYWTKKANQMWDALRGGGETGESRIAKLRQELADLAGPTPLKNASLTDAILGSFDQAGVVARLKATKEAELSYLQQVEAQTKKNTEAQGARQRAEDAANAVMDSVIKTQEKGLSKQEQMNKALDLYRDQIQKIKAVNPDSMLVTAAAVARGESAIREQYKTTEKANTELEKQARLINEIGGLRGDFTEQWNRLSAIYKAGGMNLEQLQAAQAKLLADQPAIKEQQKLYDEQQKAIAKAAAAYDQMVDATRKSADQLRTQADELEASNSMWGKGKVAIEQYRLALLEAKAAEVDQNPDSYRADYIAALQEKITQQRRIVIGTQTAEYKTLLDKQSEWLRSAQEEAQLYQDEIGLLGLTTREREKVVAVRQVELKLAKEIAAINKSGATSEQKADAIAQAQAAAEIAKQTAAAKADMNALTDIINSVDRTAQQVWTNIWQGGSDVFTKLGQTIKASVLDLLYQLTIKKWVISITANILASLGLGDVGSLVSGGSGSLLSSGANLLGVGSAATAATTATNAATAAAITGDAASSAAAASAASAAGAGSGIGALAPYAGYAAAAYAAYKLLSSLNGGETRTGGQYAVAYDGKVVNNRRGETYYYDDQYFQRPGTQKTKVTNGTAYRIEADGMGTQEDAVRTAVSSTANNIQEMLKALGSSMTLNGFWAGLETSGNGRGGVFSGGSFTNGTKFGESGKGDNYSGTLYELTSTRSPDAAAAMANFTLDLKQVTIEALQAATDIPQVIKDKLKGVDAEALTNEAADTLLTWITTQINNVNQLATLANSLPLQNLKNLSFDAASGLIELAGGIDTLSSQIDAYYKAYYTEDEQRAQTLANIKKALGTVGIDNLPTTLADYRKLVDSQDLSTEAGRKTYAMLIALASAFADVTKASDTAAASAKKEAESKAQAEKDAAAAKAEADKQAAISAANAAYSALETAISAQKTILQAQAQAAQATINTISSIMDTLKSNIDELYNSVATTQIQNQRQALEFIDQALTTAQAGGVLPDGTKLSDAINAARTGTSDSSGYASLFEQQKAQLILAGKLVKLQEIAGVQKTVAEQQLDAANKQIDQLDKTLAYWKEQTAIATGTWKATLSVVDAINALRDANAAATAATTKKPGVVVTGASDQFTVGGGGSGTGTTAAAAPKSLREIYRAAYGWTDDDFKSWYANPLNTANAEEEAKRRGIPVMAVGTNYLPRDGYIYAHQGEAIVPRAYNPAANGVLQADGQTARLLTSLIEEVRAMRASTERTASAVEGNQSVPLLVEIAS